MLEERARRTARRPERCQEPSIGRQRPAREEPRRGPAPLTARGVASTAQVQAQVLRAPRPPGAAAAAPAHPRAVFPPNLGTAGLGTKGEGAPGAAAGCWSRRPSGLGGKPSVVSSPSPLPPPHSPPAHLPLSSLPTSSPTTPLGPRPWPAASQPTLRPPLTCRRGPPEPPPPPGLGPSCRPPPHVPCVAIAFAATVISPPSPPPPPSLQSPAVAKAAPAAQSHREAPAHCAPQWGRGRPAEVWGRRVRCTWSPGRRGRRERGGGGAGFQLSAVGSARSRTGQRRGACRNYPGAWSLGPGWAQPSPPGQFIPPA